MDHHYKLGATAKVDGFLNKYYKGRRANGFYIPRFVNLDKKTKRKGYLRGFGYQGTASRGDWSESVAEMGYGKALKDELLKPGSWQIGVTGFGEFLPYDDNRVRLSETEKDKWGLPQLEFDVEFKENEYNMRKDIETEIVSMFKAAEFKDVQPFEESSVPGLGIHEMGHNVKTSVVNKNNQLHAIPNVYVADGAFMSSSSCVNPSLTYMPFTARAANHVAEQLIKGNCA
ncbi:MAG: choline dehydrogenase-like flavoprotein [Maribacter sp.]|jgi:choline dehydrogenase-like flavoprotein